MFLTSIRDQPRTLVHDKSLSVEGGLQRAVSVVIVMVSCMYLFCAGCLVVWLECLAVCASLVCVCFTPGPSSFGLVSGGVVTGPAGVGRPRVVWS